MLVALHLNIQLKTYITHIIRLPKVIREQAMLRFKLPTGYNRAPHIRPQNYPLRWTDPQTQLRYLPHPWTHPTYHPKRHPFLISRFATMLTDRNTELQMIGRNV